MVEDAEREVRCGPANRCGGRRGWRTKAGLASVCCACVTVYGGQRTLECEKANEGGEGRVVDAPSLEQPCCQLQALPACEDRLPDE